MSVYKKLQTARLRLVNTNITKSGKNKFAGYEYFELGDFIPAIHKIFDEVGLCGAFTFSADVAHLCIYDTELEEKAVIFSCPVVQAENAKGQAIQNLGSTITYLRRYLWLMAMEIVEHDSVDASPQEVKAVKPVKEVVKEVVKEAVNPDPNVELAVATLIDFAEACTTKAGLTSLWKSNQKQIDEMKVSHPDNFDNLKTRFAELKLKLEQ
jgi:predicted O-linked N-acetylglucosamine transferase (SPINDLY family)